MKKIIIIIAAFMIVSCFANQLQNSTSTDTGHTAQNSLDWAGVYQGILPCADCGGIKTTVTLTYKGNFKLEEAYDRGNTQYKPKALTGKIIWDKKRPVVYLNNKDTKHIYFVGEGYLLAYDIEGNPIESSLNYTLKKIK